MTKKSYKIVIRGGYGLTNFGDDALMITIYNFIVKFFNKKNIAFYCTPSEYLKNIVPGVDIIPLTTNRIKTKHLVFGGGTQFYSFHSEFKSFDKKRLFTKLKLLFKPKQFYSKLVGLFRRKFLSYIYNNHLNYKISAIGIGVGPFLNEGNKDKEENTKKLFRSMNFVAVRDIYSYNKCKSWELKDVKQYADICFAMEHPLFRNKNIHKSKIDKIGIIVRDWNHTKKGGKYINSLLTLVKLLRNELIEVRFIIFSKKSDTFWMDRLSQINENYLLWNPDDHSISFDNFIKHLNYFDLFITARYHGAVFSALLDKPFISIAVEQKLEMISDLFKDGSFKWEYPFTTSSCMNFIKLIDSKYIDYVENVQSIKLFEKIKAEKMMTDFADYLRVNKI